MSETSAPCLTSMAAIAAISLLVAVSSYKEDYFFAKV